MKPFLWIGAFCVLVSAAGLYFAHKDAAFAQRADQAETKATLAIALVNAKLDLLLARQSKVVSPGCRCEICECPECRCKPPKAKCCQCADGDKCVCKVCRCGDGCKCKECPGRRIEKPKAAVKKTHDGGPCK